MRRNYSNFDGNAARNIEPRRIERKKNNITRLTQKQLKEAREEKRKPHKLGFKQISLAIVFVMAAISVQGWASLTEITLETTEISNTLEELQGEQIQLEMILTEDMESVNIKEYAKNRLDMAAVLPHEVTYIEMENRDQGTVYNQSSENLFEKFLAFLGF